MEAQTIAPGQSAQLPNPQNADKISYLYPMESRGQCGQFQIRKNAPQLRFCPQNHPKIRFHPHRRLPALQGVTVLVASATMTQHPSLGEDYP